MYCPECGKELYQGSWRCESCGSDLRRILREEYWSKQETAKGGESSGDRFRMPEGSVSDLGWRDIHKTHRPALIWASISVVGLFVLAGLIYVTFTKTSPTPEMAVSEPAATAQPAPDQPAPTVDPTPSPAEPSTPPSPPVEPVPPDTEPATTTPAVLPTSGTAPITREGVETFVKNWLAEWQKSVETTNIEALSAFYSQNFKANKKNKGSWMEARLRVAHNICYLKIDASDLKIKIEGNEANVRYMQDYLSDGFSDRGVKILKIVMEENGLKIIYEGFENRTPAARISNTMVKGTIMDWRRAWEDIAINRKLGDLSSFYHPDFRGPGNRNKHAWLDLKLQVAKKFSIIAVDIREIRSSVLADRAIASFQQIFKSDKYADEGRKVLIFKLKDKKPLIINELFVMERKLEPLKVDDFWGP